MVILTEFPKKIEGEGRPSMDKLAANQEVGTLLNKLTGISKEDRYELVQFIFNDIKQMRILQPDNRPNGRWNLFNDGDTFEGSRATAFNEEVERTWSYMAGSVQNAAGVEWSNSMRDALKLVWASVLDKAQHASRSCELNASSHVLRGITRDSAQDVANKTLHTAAVNGSISWNTQEVARNPAWGRALNAAQNTMGTAWDNILCAALDATLASGRGDALREAQNATKNAVLRAAMVAVAKGKLQKNTVFNATKEPTDVLLDVVHAASLWTVLLLASDLKFDGKVTLCNVALLSWNVVKKGYGLLCIDGGIPQVYAPMPRPSHLVREILLRQ